MLLKNDLILNIFEKVSVEDYKINKNNEIWQMIS